MFKTWRLLRLRRKQPTASHRERRNQAQAHINPKRISNQVCGVLLLGAFTVEVQFSSRIHNDNDFRVSRDESIPRTTSNAQLHSNNILHPSSRRLHRLNKCMASSNTSLSNEQSLPHGRHPSRLRPPSPNSSSLRPKSSKSQPRLHGIRDIRILQYPKTRPRPIKRRSRIRDLGNDSFPSLCIPDIHGRRPKSL